LALNECLRVIEAAEDVRVSNLGKVYPSTLVRILRKPMSRSRRPNEQSRCSDLALKTFESKIRGLGSGFALKMKSNTKALRLSPMWGDVAGSFEEIYFWLVASAGALWL
jgi:hypothetical protein